MSELLHHVKSDLKGRQLLDAFRGWVQVIPLGSDRYELFVQLAGVTPGSGKGQQTLEQQLDCIDADWRGHITLP